MKLSKLFVSSSKRSDLLLLPRTNPPTKTVGTKDTGYPLVTRSSVVLLGIRQSFPLVGRSSSTVETLPSTRFIYVLENPFMFGEPLHDKYGTLPKTKGL